MPAPRSVAKCVPTVTQNPRYKPALPLSFSAPPRMPSRTQNPNKNAVLLCLPPGRCKPDTTSDLAVPCDHPSATQFNYPNRTRVVSGGSHGDDPCGTPCAYVAHDRAGYGTACPVESLHRRGTGGCQDTTDHRHHDPPNNFGAANGGRFGYTYVSSQSPLS